MFGYTQDYYENRIIARHIIEVNEKELKETNISTDKKIKKEIIIESLKYFYSL